MHKGIIIAVIIVVIIIIGIVVATVASQNARSTQAPQTPRDSSDSQFNTPVETKEDEWRCASLNNNGQWNIVKRVNGLIQCMSPNARNCWWYNNKNECQAKLSNPGTIDPLVCGEHSTAVWGAPGTDDPTHWCYSGRTDV